ncbi:hypothetical protein Selin_1426 [Desulfurispirillum indicum S5]|uniref:Uncharacterized protein n=1 Tax=Desulfurispirillum indicum (strain ATCC BAA-1389 / DSM 22839 / S5) TaxID=653733 RepID=E6W6C4_DESIS|nr:hypothetical protein Selin_1426 [Desulfurispirillum indicum S5]
MKRTKRVEIFKHEILGIFFRTINGVSNHFGMTFDTVPYGSVLIGERWLPQGGHHV